MLSIDGTSRSENSFDAIRLIAAFAVLVGHQFALTGRAEPDVSGFTTLGGLAVTVFFVTSGYFVSGSWENDPRVTSFWWKRILRLFPALIAVVALSILVLGAFETNLPVSEYLRESATWTYWKNATLVLGIQYHLPGVFTENLSSAVNGSLWTLPVELLMYALVFGAGFVFRRMSRWVFPVMTVVFAIGWVIVHQSGKFPVRMTLPMYQTLDLGVFFFAGASIRAFRSHIRLSPFWVMAGAFLAFIVIGQGGIGTRIVLWVVLPPLVLLVGAQSSAFGRRISAFGDVSYGVYLWAFPVQQVVIRHWLPTVGFAVSIFLAAGLTFVLASLSWFLIEKQALKLKGKFWMREGPESPTSDQSLTPVVPANPTKGSG